MTGQVLAAGNITASAVWPEFAPRMRRTCSMRRGKLSGPCGDHFPFGDSPQNPAGSNSEVREDESHIEIFFRDILAPVPRSAIFLIGPEGGWTQTEERAILDHGFEAVSLGNTILKSETAAIADLAVISQFWNS